jgi:hypothetical protein
MLRPCKTLDEFVQKYDKDLERILCRSFKNYIKVEELPEIKNDVYAHLLEKKFFETYDSTKAQFSTYLYTYLFKFLKGKKVKEDKELVTHALSLDVPMFEDSGTTILDIKDFNSDFTFSDKLEILDVDEKIKEHLEHKKKNLKIHNPYKKGTIYSALWEFFETPRSTKEICNFIEDKKVAFQSNPYHPKKDQIKYDIWEKFKKGSIETSENNNLWENVAGVKKRILDFSKLSYEASDVFNFISNCQPTLMECKTVLDYSSEKIDEILTELESNGFVHRVVMRYKKGKPYVYQTNFKSHLVFDQIENLTWFIISYFQENHSELFEMVEGKYFLNTQSDVTYKLFRMMLNGKTNKEIAKTYQVNNSSLNQTKDFILKDIKKLVTG